MTASSVPQSVPIETLERFSESKWPATLGEWGASTEDNSNWRAELVPEWERTVNNPYPLEKFGRSPSLMDREILKEMGLVETPRTKFRTWLAFSLFAPPEADYDLFVSRVRFTEEGLDLIESAGVVAQ